MSSVASPITFLPVSGLASGQVALLNYVHTMARLDDSPFARSAFSGVNLPESTVAAIREGRYSPGSGHFLAAASLVARTVKIERHLTRVLGDAWVEETRFVPAVQAEQAELRRVIGAARHELKLWRNTLRAFPDGGEVLDLSREEPLGALLQEMQTVLLYRITDAREILEDYGGRSLAGIEAYFQVRRERRSGPVSTVSEGPAGETEKISG
jgi:hypothetical protein